MAARNGISMMTLYLQQRIEITFKRSMAKSRDVFCEILECIQLIMSTNQCLAINTFVIWSWLSQCSNLRQRSVNTIISDGNCFYVKPLLHISDIHMRVLDTQIWLYRSLEGTPIFWWDVELHKDHLGDIKHHYR